MTILTGAGGRAAATLARRVSAVVFAALVVAGCGKNRVVAPGESMGLPPEVVEAYPAARSVHVPYDLPEVWIRFNEALDSTTVTSANVFLKRDTRREPVTVRWESATRRIRIEPRFDLQLGETYTVELTTDLKTLSGAPLSSKGWWQFTIYGLRHLEHPYPAHLEPHASPFAPLTWDRTESSAGSVTYDLYVAEDSVAVATRSVTPVTGTSAHHIRYDQTWRPGARTYWAVTARNLTQEEREDGPVWSFETAPPGAPVDSFFVPAPFYGSYQLSTSRSFCNDNRLLFGRTYNAVAAWDVAQIQPGRTVAAARIKLQLAAGVNAPISGISSTGPSVVRDPCSFSPAVPTALTFLASSNNVGGGALYYSSDALVAHLAAMHRGLPVNGFRLDGSGDATYNVPELVIYFYR